MMIIEKTKEFLEAEREINVAVAERRYDDLPALKAKRFILCGHQNTRLVREGRERMGTVVCDDCGYEREWNAY